MSAAWGLVVASLALGAGVDRSFGFLGYFAVVLCAWLWLFIRAVRGERGRARAALLAIAWSLVWPVAAVIWIARARPGPLVAHPTPSALPAPPPSSPPEAAPRPSPPPRPRAVHKASPPLSTWKAALALVGLLLAMLATYVVAGLFFLLWAVLAGIHFLTPSVTRFVAIGAAVIFAGGLIAVVDFWRRRAPASRLLRASGWAGIAVTGSAVLAVTGILVFASAPRAVLQPNVSGTVRVGSLLTARPGRWTSHSVSYGFDYQWQACGRSCSDVADATGQTYRLRPHDVARRIDVCVRAARNALGGLWQVSSGCAHSHETRPVEP